MQNFSDETGFYLHENEPVLGKYFHMNSFAQGLVLIRGQISTR